VTQLEKIAHFGHADVQWASYYEHVRLGTQPLPEGLLDLLRSRRLFTNVRWQDYTPSDRPDREDIDNLGQAEAASSQSAVDHNTHALMLDIDHDARLEQEEGFDVLNVIGIPGPDGRSRNFRYPLPHNRGAWLIPSTQENHYHLYVDVAWPWPTIGMILIDLTRAGVIEEGYAQVSHKRGFTALRLPWIAKEDADSTLAEVDADLGIFAPVAPMLPGDLF
jgi:hypothetical protein